MDFLLARRKYLGLLFCCLIKCCMNMSIQKNNLKLGNDEPSEGSCSPITPSISEEVICIRNDQVVNCSRPEDNTTAKIRCQEFYTFKGNSSIFHCNQGKWDHEFVPCSLDCGKKNSDIIQGIKTDAKIIEHEYPWVIAIYNDTSDFICSGTIISTYHILSAAHCFSDRDGKPKSKDDYTIIAGKYYSDMNISEPSEQIRKVQLLFVHENYAGNDKKYRNDIALAKLNKEFTPSMQVQSVCIDWDNIFEDFDFVDGTKGIVAGWGYTETGGSLSNGLKSIIVPYRSRQVCLQHLPVDFGQEYFSRDKICAGYRNNNTICQGHSGGGLYFQSDNKHFYIRGIVSITVRFEGTCNPKHYSLYTRISKYLPWIKRKLQALETD